jgi:cytochrome c peroxidase
MLRWTWRWGLGLTTACGGSLAYRSATPPGLDEFVAIPHDNPPTSAKAELGRRLFFDRGLSADGSVSCSSCHRPGRGFSDTLSRSIGAYGRSGTRNAPSLVNVAYAETLFWDGRVRTLEEQALRPIQDTLEMAQPLGSLLDRLRGDLFYRAAFLRAFRDGVTAANLARALASYVRSLRFGGAPIDRFRAGDTTVLSLQAQRGFRLFQGKAGCTGCHVGPNLTDEGFHNSGVSWGSPDRGRFGVTGEEADRGSFSTPSLRAIACTAPYMHDGSLPTLEAVVAFYDRGGTPNPELDETIRPLRLSGPEQADLVAFLEAMTAGCSVPFPR